MRSPLARRLPLLAALIALLLVPLPASATAPPLGAALVSDINARPTPRSSEPFGEVQIGNTLFFTASDAAHGRELWTTDGTSENTRLVKDLFPGPEGSDPGPTVALGDALIFIATGPDRSLGLWKSDGTPTGTVLLAPIASDIGNRSVAMENIGGKVFFGAGPTSDERGLWVSDGTPAGTRPLKPGIGRIEAMAQLNGMLVFATQWNGIWRSDGTPDGTFKLASPCANSFVAFSNRLFFLSYCDADYGLWTTDGSSIALVKGLAASSATALVVAAGRLFFGLGDGSANGVRELWGSDGTAQGTQLVTAIEPFQGGIDSLVAGDDELFFVAGDTSARRELWRSDGTAQGTGRVADLRPGPGGFNQGYALLLGNTLYFRAGTSDATPGLWATDGTAAGTRLVRSFPITSNDAYHPLYHFGNGLFFSADDGTHGLEPWLSDGTADGTRLLRNINPDVGESLPRSLTAAGDRLFFIADDGDGVGVWSANSAGASQAVRLTPVGGSGPPTNLVGRGNTLFFINNFDESLWRSDGTPAGTRPVKQFTGWPYGLTNVNDTLFLAQHNGLAQFPDDLWRSDGTAQGTQLLRSFPVSPLPAVPSTRIGGLDPPVYLPSNFAGFKGALYFSALDPTLGVELWRSDGTPAGTQLLKDLELGAASAFPGQLTVAGGRLFFVTLHYDGNNFPPTFALWTSDGTAQGTQRVRELPARTFSVELAAAGDHLFVQVTGDTASSLWASDGTAAGTRQLADFRSFTNYARQGLTHAALGNTLFFSADDGAHGSELWQSDGTSAGTRLVSDLQPWSLGSEPAWTVAFNNTIIFSADDGAHGRELWQTDGTAQGAHLAADIAPGADWSNPQGLAVAGGLVYFSADDGEHGRELWRWDGTPAGTALAVPPIVGAAPGATVAVPLRIARGAPALGAGTATLTATLPSALRYVADTSGATPSASGSALTWRMPAPAAGEQRSFALQLDVPNAPLGTRFPLTLTLTAPGPDGAPTTISQRVEVLVARQVWLPLVAK